MGGVFEFGEGLLSVEVKDKDTTINIHELYVKKGSIEVGEKIPEDTMTQLCGQLRFSNPKSVDVLLLALLTVKRNLLMAQMAEDPDSVDIKELKQIAEIYTLYFKK